MFVLYETSKAVQKSSYPHMGVMLAAALLIIAAFAVWAVLNGRRH